MLLTALLFVHARKFLSRLRSRRRLLRPLHAGRGICKQSIENRGRLPLITSQQLRPVAKAQNLLDAVV